MIKVSLIIPLYNAADTIVQCLSSVAEQTLDGIEVILVDDCSTDGSLRIAQNALMSGKFAWQCVSQPANAGPGAARNTGMEHAAGKYIAFIDADDRIAPDYCRRLYEAAEEQGADMVWCNAAEVSAEGAEEAERAEGKPVYVRTLSNHYHEDRGKLLRTMVTYLWTCMFRREFIQAQGICFPATRCAEDSCFVLGAAMAAGIITTVDETLYEYRIAGNSLSRRRNRRRAHERMKSMSVLRKWAKEQGFASLYRCSLAWIVFKKGWLLAAKDLITG